MDTKRRAEYLRTPETVCQPDPRNRVFGIPPPGVQHNGQPFEDHYRAIAAITLHEGVPEPIVIQFETAKNVWLYAWFVYRFYPVAEGQAFACLELALHTRLEQEMIEAGWEKKEFGFGLRNYLKYAAKRGYIRNEDFEVWRLTSQARAKQRHLIEMVAEMQRSDIGQMENDDSRVEITDRDRDHDYVTKLPKTIPWLRNHLAHGSTLLHKGVSGTFRLVSEIVNKLWPLPGGEDGVTR